MTGRPMRRGHASPAARGFTAIEVLVAVLMAAVLASIALPAYREQVARGHRVAVQSALLENAQALQRYYDEHDTWEGARDADLATTRSPREGAGPAYVITVEAVPASQRAWSLVATPVGPMAGDRCGRFTLDQLGQRGVVNPRGEPADRCWR